MPMLPGPHATLSHVALPSYCAAPMQIMQKESAKVLGLSAEHSVRQPSKVHMLCVRYIPTQVGLHTAAQLLEAW